MRNSKILLGLILLFACNERAGDKGGGQMPSDDHPTERSYTIMHNDSAYDVSYRFSRKSDPGGAVVLSYFGPAKDSMRFICDSARKIYKGIFATNDTTNLVLESERFYTINGKDLRVLKLMRDKDVTDGEWSYFINTDLGLLLDRSNTWRSARILNVQSDSSDLRLRAVLYKVLADQEFIMGEPPARNIKKFTTPRVE